MVVTVFLSKHSPLAREVVPTPYGKYSMTIKLVLTRLLMMHTLQKSIPTGAPLKSKENQRERE
jgi:hypothetical protein